MKKQKTDDLKIFISAHKPTDSVQDDIFTVVQVGAGLPNKKKIPNTQRDNTGDNISDKNPRFCELTAQYWAWKNQKADYYGFFHYRRYLSFNESTKFSTDAWGNVLENCINEDFVEKHSINAQDIREMVIGNNYDIVLPKRKNILLMPNMGKNMREQYLGSGFLHEEDLDIMLDVLKEKHPEYMPYADQYFKGHYSYLNNMFIMKKGLFNEYCEWLFDILLECDKRIDYKDYSVEAIRTPGHLAERLLNIFVAYKNRNNELKIKELETVAIINTDSIEDYKPAFDKNNVAVALSANDFYVPYLATVITSIVENSNKDNNYDLFVMHKDISQVNKSRLLNIISNNKNFSIRFIDISRYEDRFKKLFTRGHFTIETWFRLLMPEILKSYKKMLYIDSDLVVDHDLAELYNTDIDGYLLGACRDADTAGLYNGAEKNKKNYMDNILKIKDPYSYFQAGVILFNLDEFRKQYSTDEMLKYASSYDFELLDQDVLNNLAQGRVKYLDMSWNVMFDWNYYRINEIISKAPKYLYDEYMEARKDAKIIHFAGPDKPWHQPMSDFAETFWKYARKTVFYEEILLRMNDASTFGFFQKTKFKNRLREKVLRDVLPKGSNRRKIAKKVYNKFN